MGTYAVQARFESRASTSDVMRWITDTDGIAGWWSDGVTGSASAQGDQFHVTFPTTNEVFDLVVTEMSDGVVEWYVPESPPWWKGTTIRFELGDGADGEGTSLLFTHRGFEPDDPVIAVITPAWVRFIDNLISVAEAGKAAPAVVN